MSDNKTLHLLYSLEDAMNACLKLAVPLAPLSVPGYRLSNEENKLESVVPKVRKYEKANKEIENLVKSLKQEYRFHGTLSCAETTYEALQSATEALKEIKSDLSCNTGTLYHPSKLSYSRKEILEKYCDLQELLAAIKSHIDAQDATEEYHKEEHNGYEENEGETPTTIPLYEKSTNGSGEVHFYDDQQGETYLKDQNFHYHTPDPRQEWRPSKTRFQKDLPTQTKVVSSKNGYEEGLEEKVDRYGYTLDQHKQMIDHHNEIISGHSKDIYELKRKGKGNYDEANVASYRALQEETLREIENLKEECDQLQNISVQREEEIKKLIQDKETLYCDLERLRHAEVISNGKLQKQEEELRDLEQKNQECRDLKKKKVPTATLR